MRIAHSASSSDVQRVLPSGAASNANASRGSRVVVASRSPLRYVLRFALHPLAIWASFPVVVVENAT